MAKTYHDRESIHQLVERNKNNIYRLAILYCKNSADADDIFQEVFYRYCKTLPEFSSFEHEKAWFIRVTLNCCKNFVRSAWFRKTTALEEDLIQPESEEYELYEYLLKLPANYRTVIYLHYYQGYRLVEIAEMMGKKPSSIRTTLQRAKQKLKEEMVKEGLVWNQN